MTRGGLKVWILLSARGLVLKCLFLTLATLICSDAETAPAPPPNPKRKDTEALLYLKRVRDKTDQEQAAIRQSVLDLLRVRLALWLYRPETEIPELTGAFSIRERGAWVSKHLKLAYVEDTGVLRITCSGGTPREQAIFVNKVVEQCLVSYADRKKDLLGSIASFQAIVEQPTTGNEQEQKERADALNKVKSLQKQLADLPELIRLLTVA